MDRNLPSEKSESLSRRSFAKATIGAAAVALIPASEAIAQDKAKTPPATQEGKPADLSDADWNEVQSKYANLLRVYGERLSADEKRRALKILITNQYMLASIRLFVVQNGDPSALTLRV
jgi:hypothetical protein